MIAPMLNRCHGLLLPSHNRILHHRRLLQYHRHLSSNSDVIINEKRRLDVAIVGLPNAGKSQLLNVLTNTPIAAVSRKRHTTRNSIIGVQTIHETIPQNTSSKTSTTSTISTKNTNNHHQEKNKTPRSSSNHTRTTQLVYIDTPGFMKLKTAREEKLFTDLVSNCRDIESADYTLLVVDAARTMTDDVKETLTALMLRAQNSLGRYDDDDDDISDDNHDENEENIPREKFGIVLNKVDLVKPKTLLLEIATELGLLGDTCVQYQNIHKYPTETIKKAMETKLRLKDTDNTGATKDHQRTTDDDKYYDEQVKKFLYGLSIEDQQSLQVQYPTIFFTSALDKEGIDDIFQHLIAQATPCTEFAVSYDNNGNLIENEMNDGTAPLDDDTTSDSMKPHQRIRTSSTMSLIEHVEEIIREKIYRCLHREVPHQVKQINRLVKEIKIPSQDRSRTQKILRIDQDLVVKTKSHHRLVMGRGGMTLRRIRESALVSLRLFAKEYDDVMLNLHVKIGSKGSRKNWDRDHEVDAQRHGVIQRNL